LEVFPYQMGEAAPAHKGVLRPKPQAARFRFLGSFRQSGILPMRWRDVP
jgi:hypothetical protein